MTGTDVSTAKAKKARSPPAHPPFVEMIMAAIVSLKDRTGSSQYAITKFVEEKHKNLPPTFKKLLLNHLKKLVAAGKLVKVKNSFKLPPVRSAAPAKEKAAAAAPKPKKSAAVVAKPKSKMAAKPKAKAVASKPKPAAAKPKVKAIAALAKPAAKAARTSTRTSPGKKAEVKSKAKAKAKKPVAPARAVRKPKSVKSPVKRKAPARKAKK